MSDNRLPTPVTRARKRKLWIVLLLLLVLLPMLWWLSAPVYYLGTTTVDVLRHPDRVQAFKILPERSQDAVSGDAIDGHPIIAAGQILDAGNGAAAGRILTSPNAYVANGLPDFSACELAPGLAFRFLKGHQRVEVMTCYFCGHIVVLTEDASGHVSKTYMTPFAVAQLKPFYRQAFPGQPDSTLFREGN